jgi:hypothetical protein
MKSVKYIGLDVHQATISIAVLDANGKLTIRIRELPQPLWQNPG